VLKAQHDHSKYSTYSQQLIGDLGSHTLIDWVQPLKDTQVAGSLEISYFIQRELINHAHRGELLVSKDDFIEDNYTPFNKKFGVDFKDVLESSEDAKVIHTTIRKFPEIDPLSYIGLLLDTLTIDSLCWAIRSI